MSALLLPLLTSGSAFRLNCFTDPSVFPLRQLIAKLIQHIFHMFLQGFIR